MICICIVYATYEATNTLMLDGMKKCYHILFAQGEESFTEVWQQTGGRHLCAIVRLTLRSLQRCTDRIAIGTHFLEVKTCTSAVHVHDWKP